MPWFLCLPCMVTFSSYSVGTTNQGLEHILPYTLQRSRCHQPSDLGICEAFHEVFAHTPGAPSALWLLIIVRVIRLTLGSRRPLGLPLRLSVRITVIGLSLRQKQGRAALQQVSSLDLQSSLCPCSDFPSSLTSQGSGNRRSKLAHFQ